MDFFGIGVIIVIGAGVAWVILSKGKDQSKRSNLRNRLV